MQKYTKIVLTLFQSTAQLNRFFLWSYENPSRAFGVLETT